MQYNSVSIYDMYIAGMMPPLEHPKKEVRKALKQARAARWSVVRSRGYVQVLPEFSFWNPRCKVVRREVEGSVGPHLGFRGMPERFMPRRGMPERFMPRRGMGLATDAGGPGTSDSA